LTNHGSTISAASTPRNATAPVDISNAVAWLVSDEARYVTGITLPIDGGMTAPFKLPHI
jgi:NAD(P)-dependent dehydrogenase (short-subunit alcohol dehydrogenase family)